MSEYLLFYVHIILFRKVVPGKYEKRNIPITNRKRIKPAFEKITCGII
jgi:hypothetical protein